MLLTNLRAAGRHIVRPAGWGHGACVAVGAVGVASYVMHGPLVSQYAFAAVLMGVSMWVLSSAMISSTSDEVPVTLHRLAICSLPLAGLLIQWLAFVAVVPASVVFTVSALSVGCAVALFVRLRACPLPVHTVNSLRHLTSSRKTVVVLAIFWAVLYSSSSVLQWWNLVVAQSQDLAIHEQALYNSLHGDWLTYTVDYRYPGKSMHRFADHFEPTLLLLLPLYALWQSPALLLIVQASVIASGAIPVSSIARRFTGMPSAGLVMAAAYLMHPGLHHGLMTEFHMGVLAAPLILWGLHFALSERLWPAVAFFILALGCKENIAATVFVVGLYLAIRGQRRFGIGVAVLALLWGYFAVQVIIPHFSPTGAYLYGSFNGMTERFTGASCVDISGLYAVTNRVGYVFALIGPVALLALLAPLEALIALPEFVLHMVSGHAAMLVLTAHYHVTIVAGIVVAACAGFRRLTQTLSKWLGEEQAGVRRVLLLGLSAYVVFYWVQATPAALRFERPVRIAISDTTRARHLLLATIPDDVALLTNRQTCVNHLARRRNLTLLTDSSSLLTVPFECIQNAEYLLFVVEPQNYDQIPEFEAKYRLRRIGSVQDNFVWRNVYAEPPGG